MGQRIQLKTYLINLDRSSERLQYMDDLLRRLGVSFTRISAVDGKEIDRPDTASTALTLPEIGCFLSHRSVWKRMVLEGISVALIIEDDIELSPDLPLLIKDQQWLPGDDFIIKLDTTGTRVALAETGLKAPTGRNLLELKGRHCGTGGYLLSNAAARRLIELSKTMTVPVDLFLFDAKQCRTADINVFQMVPAPIAHKIVVEDVTGTAFETTIPKQHLMKPARRVSGREKLKRELRRLALQSVRPLLILLGLTSERHIKAKFR